MRIARVAHRLREIDSTNGSLPHSKFRCRRWLSSGGYESISKQVFSRARNYSTFLLEYDDRRSGGFEPLADLPRDSVVVLGLVSSKKNQLESADELRTRINEAARYFPLDQMGLSTQCGFASGIKGNPVDAEMQEKKLRLVADVAHTERDVEYELAS